MELTIKINLDNDAFMSVPDADEYGSGILDCTEIRSILTKLCRVNFMDIVRVDDKKRPILDTNGNSVGYWEITK